MYDIPYFKADHPDQVIRFVQEHPFAILCGSGENGMPAATHLPLLLEERENKLYLQGHCMRKQDHTRAYGENPQVLAIFSDAHAYVSASWYQQKQVASTWNYQAVHVRGHLRFLGDDALLDLLSRLTKKMEQDDSPSLLEHLDPEYVGRMMKAIVAFEITVTAVEHVFKLSQNRDAESHRNIVDQLRRGDDGARQIARVMEERKPAE